MEQAQRARKLIVRGVASGEAGGGAVCPPPPPKKS